MTMFVYLWRLLYMFIFYKYVPLVSTYWSEKTELNLKLASLITHDSLPPTHMTNKNNPSFWIFKSYFRISGNFLKVVIYYEDLNYEEIKEEPMYDVSTFKY